MGLKRYSDIEITQKKGKSQTMVRQKKQKDQMRFTSYND
jgi:hypothetical protein